MNRTDRPIVNPIVVLREEFDDWAILFNPDTANAVGINPVGVAVWKMINGKRRVKEIVFEIKDKFANVSETVYAEIENFVENLSKHNYIGYEIHKVSDGGITQG